LLRQPGRVVDISIRIERRQAPGTLISYAAQRV
jgi:hypothetical protein